MTKREPSTNDGPIIACTLTDDELDRRFDSGYGGTQGAPFTAWPAS